MPELQPRNLPPCQLPHPTALAPSCYCGCPFPGWPPLTSSGAGGEGIAQTSQALPFHGPCQVEAWPLGGDGSCQRGGGQSMGVKSFAYNHIIHWEFGGSGALGHSPNVKGNRTVNGILVHHWPCQRVQTAFPGNICPVTPGGPAHPSSCPLLRTGVGSFGDTGDSWPGETGLAQAGSRALGKV